MLQFVDEGTTFISYAKTLGVEEIVLGKKIQRRGKVKIIKEDILEYQLMRKNIYINDMEDYTSIFNMKIANYSCLSNKKYQNSLYFFVQKIAIFSSQNLLLLELSEKIDILDDLLRLIQSGNGDFKVFFTQPHLAKQLLSLADKFITNQYSLFKIFSKMVNEEISIWSEKVDLEEKENGKLNGSPILLLLMKKV